MKLNFRIPSQYYVDIIGLHIINITSNDSSINNNTFEVNITDMVLAASLIETKTKSDTSYK